MTKRRFAGRLGFALVLAMAFAAPAASAQSDQPAEPAPAKAGKLINAGGILSGELTTIRTRGGKRGGKTATYQITSEPRRLPPPNGLCNLETGPETFQLVTTSDAQANQLKNMVGKEIRINRLGPFLHRRQIKIRNNDGGRLLVRQLKEFPIGDHDDAPDALEGAIRLLSLLGNARLQNEIDGWEIANV